MNDPTTERAYYLAVEGDGMRGVLLVDREQVREAGVVQVRRQLPAGAVARSGGVRAVKAWLARAVVRWHRAMPRRTSPRGLSVPVLALLLAVSPVAAEPGPERCSLDWPELRERFSPASGWELATAPVPFSIRADGLPRYQAQVFEARDGSQMALIIAQWGDPGSPELGAVVYCTVRSADGAILEEVGQNPLNAYAARPGLATRSST